MEGFSLTKHSAQTSSTVELILWIHSVEFTRCSSAPPIEISYRTADFSKNALTARVKKTIRPAFGDNALSARAKIPHRGDLLLRIAQSMDSRNGRESVTAPVGAGAESRGDGMRPFVGLLALFRNPTWPSLARWPKRMDFLGIALL